MKQLGFTNFDDLRRWFNRNFFLSLDGKFKGLSTAALVLNLDNLLYKLYKVLSGRYRKPIGDILSFRVSGHSVKLYAR